MCRRTVSQPAVLLGSIGAIIFALAPPLGGLLFIIAYVIQRSYTKARMVDHQRAYERAQERADMAFIAAVKSLPR